MEFSLVTAGVLLAMLVVARAAYVLGRLHRNRTLVCAVHRAIMSNLNRGHETRLAEDMMAFSLFVGAQDKSERRYRQMLANPRLRDKCRAEARAFITTLLEEG